MNITEVSVDRRKRKAVDAVKAGVEAAFERLPPHWRNEVPEFAVVVTDRPLSEIPELKGMDLPRPNPSVFHTSACLLTAEEHESVKGGLDTIFVTTQNRVSGEIIREQEAFLRQVAVIIRRESEKVAAALRSLVPPRIANPKEAPAVRFVESFAKFILNPRYQERFLKPSHDFMTRLDAALKNGKVPSKAN